MAKTRGKQKHYVAGFAVGGVVSVKGWGANTPIANTAIAGVLTPSITTTSLLDAPVDIPALVVTAQLRCQDL